MTPEFLEYELRRLPDVVSVAVDDSAVTLLVSPSADADAIRVSVAAMLAAAAVELDVKVLGGVSATTVTRMRVAPIAVGSAAGIGLLATAAAVAALTGAIHLGNPQVHQPTAAARPPATAAPQSGGPASSFPTVVVPGSPVVPAPSAGSAPQGPSTTLPTTVPALQDGMVGEHVVEWLRSELDERLTVHGLEAGHVVYWDAFDELVALLRPFFGLESG